VEGSSANYHRNLHFVGEADFHFVKRPCATRSAGPHPANIWMHEIGSYKIRCIDFKYDPGILGTIAQSPRALRPAAPDRVVPRDDDITSRVAAIRGLRGNRRPWRLPVLS